MTTGHKATGAGLGGAPPDAAAGLTGAWTARPATSAPEVLERVERPTPAPELLITLTGRHNAGLSLGRLGRWTEAGEVHRAVAAEREHVLGPDHPDTLASRYEVGFTLSRTGRAAEALREYARVARGRERALGPTIPTPWPRVRRWRTYWASWAVTSRRTRRTPRCSPPGSVPWAPTIPTPCAAATTWPST